MRYMSTKEQIEAEEYMLEAAEAASQASCQRHKCGSVIVGSDGTIIGRGFNSPPANREDQRRCGNEKELYNKRVTDKTCCVHAEQRAIIEALKTNPTKIVGSRLYFIRLDERNLPTRAGKPYCTICSKMALDVGIKEFVLWHEEGIGSYNTDEYNKLSFEYSD
ncbi:MAG: hypothetical protein KGH65_00565 [Candidatus Micrarchaeota archaeon]|nr:hypothetical protein [Candidatus Micrarchaeota archaeon]